MKHLMGKVLSIVAGILIALGNPLSASGQMTYEEYEAMAAALNAEGSKAIDFAIELRDGSQLSLDSLVEEKPCNTNLLLFYNPDCDDCHHLLKSLAKDSEIKHYISNGVLNVIAVDSDEDYNLWLSTNSELPDEWSVGFDRGETVELDLYIFDNYPAMYLLDSKGIVLLKHPDLKSLKAYLGKINN